MREFFQAHRIPAMSLLLAIMIAAVYWQVGGHGFINLDDRLYVVENRYVSSGLSVENVRWAFTSFRASNWHPLTWISHMADCEMFGMKPGMHHLVNVLFHITNSILLFLVLYEMVGKFWRSAFVAFLFALHPLHVESVAWIAERKDVLSAFFWMLAMLFYFRYAKHPGVWRYTVVLAAFILGLMSKPMVVTLPFVFLLLDFWPLRRMQLDESEPVSQEAFGRKRIPYLLLEKAPLFLLAAASGIMTVIAQKSGGAIASMESLPFGERVANAVVSYALYAYNAAWPFNLAFFYPHPQAVPWMQVTAAAGVLVLITVGAVLSWRRYPYLLAGWFWYLGTLVPVIGIVQVGSQAMADRYTYIPLIGIFVMVSWGAFDLASHLRVRKDAAGAAACGFILVLAALTWRQAGYWHDDIKLSTHAIEATRGNYLAHNNRGLALEGEGKAADAVSHYKKAIEANPRYLDAYVNLGVALTSLGRYDEAEDSYEKAVRIRPASVEARVNLGSLLLRSGRVDDAIGHFSEALKSGGGSSEVYNALGVALAQKGDFIEAAAQFREAVRIDPGNEGARMNLDRVESMRKALGHGGTAGEPEKAAEAVKGTAEKYVKLGDAYRSRGDRLEAVRQYQAALALDKGNVPALSRLAMAYGEVGADKRALEVLKVLAQKIPGSPDVYYNVACIYAKHGQVDESVKWLKVAVDRGFRDKKQIAGDKDLENIRGSAYYMQLMGELHQP